ncbi:unnamed protein product, partial [Dibothriocephalus latus]
HNNKPDLPHRRKREGSIPTITATSPTPVVSLRSITPVFVGFRKRNTCSNSCRRSHDKHQGQLINFHKHKREYAVLSKLLELQRSMHRFNLVENKDFAAWLRGLPLLSEEEA